MQPRKMKFTFVRINMKQSHITAKRVETNHFLVVKRVHGNILYLQKYKGMSYRNNFVKIGGMWHQEYFFAHHICAKKCFSNRICYK